MFCSESEESYDENDATLTAAAAAMSSSPKSPLSCGEGTMVKFNGFNSDVVFFAQRVKKAMTQLRPKMIKWSKRQFSFQHI